MRNAIGGLRHGGQSALAHHLGVTPQTVNKWSRGETSPRPQLWHRIEKFFDWAPETIAAAAGLRGVDEYLRFAAEHSPSNQTEARLDWLEAQVLDLRRRLDELEGMSHTPRLAAASQQGPAKQRPSSDRVTKKRPRPPEP